MGSSFSAIGIFEDWAKLFAMFLSTQDCNTTNTGTHLEKNLMGAKNGLRHVATAHCNVAECKFIVYYINENYKSQRLRRTFKQVNIM